MYNSILRIYFLQKKVFSVTKYNLKNWNTDIERNYYLVFRFSSSIPKSQMMPFITKGPALASYVVLTVSLILITGKAS